MVACAGSDFATCLDTRCSLSGGAVMLGNGNISWYFRTQEVTASATSEAEYVALAETVKELLFLRHVQLFNLPSIGSHAITIKDNTQGTINKKYSSEWTRYIDLKHHVMRIAVNTGR